MSTMAAVPNTYIDLSQDPKELMRYAVMMYNDVEDLKRYVEWRGPRGEFIDLSSFGHELVKLATIGQKHDMVEYLLAWRRPEDGESVVSTNIETERRENGKVDG